MTHLKRSAIAKAYHILIYSFHSNHSISMDSNTLMLVNTIDRFFDTPYSFEIYDESQIKYLKGKPLLESISSMRYQFWPKYVSGNIFYNSVLDILSASIEENDSLFDIVSQMLDMESNRSIDMVRYLLILEKKKYGPKKFIREIRRN